MSAPLLEIRGLVKDYQALRPLRIRELSVSPRARCSASPASTPPAAEIVRAPRDRRDAARTKGDISLFGTNTRGITDAEAWLHSLDGLGMVTIARCSIDMLSVLQNVAMPLTLDVDPIDRGVRPQAEALARDAGIAESLLGSPAGHVDRRDQPARAPGTRARARAAAVIAEHPSAALPRDAVPRVADHVAPMARGEKRGAADAHRGSRLGEPHRRRRPRR